MAEQLYDIVDWDNPFDGLQYQATRPASDDPIPSYYPDEDELATARDLTEEEFGQLARSFIGTGWNVIVRFPDGRLAHAEHLYPAV